MKHAIVVENLTKSYGNHLAVDDLSFNVEYGEVFALIGPNGAGKSTTIRMILDIIRPDSGKVSVLGGEITDEKKDKIGYLPEERGLYKNVPLVQLLAYLGQLKGMTKNDAEQRATALLEQLDLGDYKKEKVTALSKGMAQKVQFIATVLHHPELIIIDEPFSGLDPVNTQILKDLLFQMKHEGSAVVMSSHQMPQLQEMGDRMLMISKGRRVLYGAIQEVREQYAENAVIVSGEGDWSKLPDVTRIVPSKNGDALLYLESNVTPDHLLRAIADGDYQLRQFELAVPSLEEIFIRVAGEQ